MFSDGDGNSTGLCRYQDYNLPPWDEFKYQRSLIFYHIMFAKEFFMVQLTTPCTLSIYYLNSNFQNWNFLSLPGLILYINFQQIKFPNLEDAFFLDSIQKYIQRLFYRNPQVVLFTK